MACREHARGADPAGEAAEGSPRAVGRARVADGAPRRGVDVARRLRDLPRRGAPADPGAHRRDGRRARVRDRPADRSVLRPARVPRPGVPGARARAGHVLPRPRAAGPGTRRGVPARRSPRSDGGRRRRDAEPVPARHHAAARRDRRRWDLGGHRGALRPRRRRDPRARSRRGGGRRPRPRGGRGRTGGAGPRGRSVPSSRRRSSICSGAAPNWSSSVRTGSRSKPSGGWTPSWPGELAGARWSAASSRARGSSLPDSRSPPCWRSACTRRRWGRSTACSWRRSRSSRWPRSNASRRCRRRRSNSARPWRRAGASWRSPDGAPAVLEPADPADLPADPTVALDEVGFAYADEASWALRDVDLRLEPGRSLALVGPSGSGKSTVAALMVRFLDPDRGHVTLGHEDLRSLRQADVRSRITLDGQDAFLFSTTILENVRLARPGADDAAVEAALRRAKIWDWVQDLRRRMGDLRRRGRRGRLGRRAAPDRPREDVPGGRAGRRAR